MIGPHALDAELEQGWRGLRAAGEDRREHAQGRTAHSKEGDSSISVYHLGVRACLKRSVYDVTTTMPAVKHLECMSRQVNAGVQMPQGTKKVFGKKR